MSDARERILRLVRRARRRLETIRYAKAFARGTLAGGLLGLAGLLAGRAHPPLAMDAACWLAPLAGGLAALLLAVRGRRIEVAAAALFLDDRLGTKQRIATLATRAPDGYTARVARELAAVEALPAFPFPRELALVPAAFFALFAASLLPPAGAAPAARPGAVVAEGAGGAAAEPVPGEEPLDVEAALEAARAPRAANVAALRAVIRKSVQTPEERRRAQDALEKAVRGDGDAAAELEAALEAALGGAGEGAIDPANSGGPVPAETRGARRGVAYPEEEAYLRAYRAALAEKETR